MSGKSEMTAWKSAFFLRFALRLCVRYGERRDKCHFFRQNIFSRSNLNERKSPKADVPKVKLGLSANKTWGESVQMYLVLTESRLVIMKTSVVLFRRSFLFRSTNRNWSAQRGISPRKWSPDNLFPLEICLCRTRLLLLQ